MQHATSDSTANAGENQSDKWVRPLLRWFRVNRRDMPWRKQPTPYAVWISEIMLQQTQVATVTPYFKRFMRQFPSLRKLAAADLQDVLKTWEGLGYYSRARNLHRAAGQIVSCMNGKLPRSAKELATLPGIGPYAAAAVASIVFGEPIPAVDGNVVRVITRLRGIDELSTTTGVRRRIADYLADNITVTAPGDFNQALMELGAVVCRPRAPDCNACPLQRYCVACATNRTTALPVRPERKPVPHYDVAACVIQKRGRILITRRPADRMLGGLWEFPGGKRLPNEALIDAAHREIREELNIRITVGKPLCTVKHAYSHFRITLHAFLCRHIAGRPVARECDELRWVPLQHLHRFPFPAADRKVLAVLQQSLSD